MDGKMSRLTRRIIQSNSIFSKTGNDRKLSYEAETVFTLPPVLKQYVKMVAE
jgi:hypothetical protein